MEHPVEHIIDIIIGIIVLFLLPIIFFGLKQDAIVQTLAQTKTEEFVNEVKRNGYLNKAMYESYVNDLAATGLLYDISFEHSHYSFEPEYRFRTEEEVIEEQNNSYTGENYYTYRPVHTDIPHVEDPIDNSGNLNTETNESILSGAVRTPPAPEHEHTQECYLGHKHIDHEKYKYTHKHDYTCKEYTSRQTIRFRCSSCGAEYDVVVRTSYWDNNLGRVVDSYVRTGNDDLNACWDCHKSSGLTTYQILDYAYSCGYSIDLDGDGYTDQVGTDRAYEYLVSTPPGENRATYNSGCYTYHRTRIPSPINSYGVPTYNDTVFQEIVYYGTDYYCVIPKFYEFSIIDNFNEDTYFVKYEAILNESGQVELKYNSASFTAFFNCKYPSTITWSEASRLRSASELRKFFYEHTNIPTYYISSDIDNSQRYTEQLLACSYDHTNANRWVITCGYEEEDTTHDCKDIIVDIKPTHPNQTVYTNDPLITTVYVTYADGSTYIVEASTDFSTNNVVSNNKVTLTYTNIVEDTSTTHKCDITVTVIPRNKKCTHGHTYNLNPNGTDPGCPYCKAYLSKLEVVNPSNGIIEIYKGTTLSSNGVTLLATYMNGREEYLYTEYVDNLDTNYVGKQTVTISYKGKYVTLTVITKRNLKLCNVCNRKYELYPDESDPGCPYCAARTPIFTGNILEYENKIYKSDILKEIYDSNGTYYFTRDDYFEVKIKNITKGMGNRLISTIFKGLHHNHINIKSGGYIREEIIR